MHFVCPACGKPELEIVLSLELPPAGHDDEVTVQTLECAGCDFCGIAVYRESRHGALGSELWSHSGYELESGALEGLRAAILSCPSPRDNRCRCGAHASFAKISWSLPSQHFNVKRAFTMKMA